MLTGVLGFPGRPHGLKGIPGRNQVKDAGMKEGVRSGGWYESLWKSLVGPLSSHCSTRVWTSLNTGLLSTKIVSIPLCLSSLEDGA